MRNALKIEVDVSIYTSTDVLRDQSVLEEISTKVIDILSEQGQTASINSIMKASKNAISLLLSRKKIQLPSFLSIYLPLSNVEKVCDTIVPSISSDNDTSESNDESDTSFRAADSNDTFSQSDSHDFHESFSFDGKVLVLSTKFEYLLEYFKHSLSNNNRPMNLEKILSDVCSYVFIQLKCSVNIRNLRNELSLQLSHLVQSARTHANRKSVTGILRSINQFSLIFKSIYPLEKEQFLLGFIQYSNDDGSGPILMIREKMEGTYVFQFFPQGDLVEITFNEMFTKDALFSFDSTKSLDIDEICRLVRECSVIKGLNIDPLTFIESAKTKILFERSSRILNSYFITVAVKCTNQNDVQTVGDHCPANNSFSFDEEEINNIIGRTYTTRGIKRSYEEDSISIEPNRNSYRRNKTMKDQRDLLHLKDTYHVTDSAFNAIVQYMRSKRKIFSLKQIERLRKKTNDTFPILFTSNSAYVKFEYAVRVAIFVARKYEEKLDQFDTLHIRFNMDGTLVGNKHLVAISINCIEGGRQCQSAKNLVPLGLFEVQKENTEILRTSLPVAFINDIKSVKHISVGSKNIDIRVRLGGDLMNAVYVFGLAGFSSNYPCIFCTQHKDDLHITDDTAYDKTVTEGKGKNKQTTTIRIGPTSYYDPSKRARSLAEQRGCLAKEKNNDLGYKCEPLFGDLFDYQHYCVDTLHMKLRVFDVILKDMLACASRTGKYGNEHLTIIENKIKILNRHCEKTVGKRFFFQIDSTDKNKTIASHGKLSGHLQDLFFVDSFPYEEILDKDLARSARKVVNKFKEILNEVKFTSVKRKGVLKRLSLEFVKEFRQSGLRTSVTPYIHIIGNHLFEFDELNDLGDYNMQGVEKNNDLLSRLYFSSTNPARNPLLTMFQKLYRMLEMNFENQREREAMTIFARTGVYDFVENTAEDDENDVDDHILHRTNEVKKIENLDVSDREMDQSMMNDENEADDDTESEESMTWSPMKRFNIVPPTASANRFKSFRRS